MNKFTRNSTGTKWKSTDLRHLELTNCIVAFIAHDLLPLSLVESERFRILMATAEPMFTMPSRKHLISVLLPQHLTTVQTRLKTQLQQVQNLCLTIYLWSSRDMRSFIGVTGHFILDHTMNSVMLACRRFKGSHTSDNIYDMYQETVASYDVGSKVTTIITDNAANMVKTFTLFPVEQLDEDEEDDEFDDNDCDILPPDDTTKFECLPPNRSPCFAHTLQLVVKDGMEQDSQIKQILAKVSKLINFCRKSTVAAEVLSNEFKLQMATCTRWNSQLTMMRSVLRVLPEVWDKLDTPYKLKQYELNTIKELCDILEPFEYVTNQIRGQNMVTSSLVVNCVRGLRAALASLHEVYKSKLVSVLQSSTETRLNKFESMEAFQLAATLDPRYKLDWCHDYDNEVQDIRDLLTVKYIMACSFDPTTTDTSPAEPPPMKRNKFFALVNRSSTPRPTPSETEVSLYLNQPCLQEDGDPLGYWKAKQPEFPVLARLAAKYLAIPATSAPVERMFSIVGKLFRPERCNLRDKRFEQLMMIRCNPQ
ncbi:zinc finger BED domain-containing protein 4-like isoform X2 [Homarus americanus]|nr:zinc finger BED domain-containing protein 4-like isoform X2 [Homarus americanus]